MKSRKIIVTEEAEADLNDIALWIAMEASVTVALRFTDRVRKHLAGFDMAAERGTERSSVEPGLRAVGFAGTITIAFKVYPDEVTIQRIYYRGTDWSAPHHARKYPSDD